MSVKAKSVGGERTPSSPSLTGTSAASDEKRVELAQDDLSARRKAAALESLKRNREALALLSKA